ncbi:hypothetical protein FH608_043370 [Nonomuraea phyllanthi]|uniref:Carbohydrate kinase PfkB domain-containing protein n=1 Tax=Nonomuraea phyllanthi TaxID=2219224 RepID=A0A5C4VDP4_9ACTN|nr:PfkB family carbohydrate kinase [Nonomuraea phyllanthi]KAB8188605.1 hypothetical protein FH608_043370 [Nonomuraea phyllanthi]
MGSGARYYRSGSAGSRLHPDDPDLSLIRSARVLHITGITLALSDSAREAVRVVLAEARDAGVLVSMDVNHRHTLWSRDEASTMLRETLPSVDVLFATEEEARLVVDEHDPVDLTEAPVRCAAVCLAGMWRARARTASGA